MDEDAPSLRFFGIGPCKLPAVLRLPECARGLIVFAHGSGSSHLSKRNNCVSEHLAEAGFASLLFDLLTLDEAHDRTKAFDIDLLAARLLDAAIRMRGEPEVAHLPIGLFGASTGAGAALLAAAKRPDLVAAIVSRGGRPDLAGAQPLSKVRCPVQLIIGSADVEVIALNRAAAKLLECPHEIAIVPNAGHLFEEQGALERVMSHACRWFEAHLVHGEVEARQRS